jgi:HSP20 family molecular chaperone IbpA
MDEFEKYFYSFTHPEVDVNNYKSSKKSFYKLEELEDAELLKVALPGVEKEDIKVKVKKDVLTVEVPESEFTDEVQLYLMCNTDITEENISTDWINGVLSILITKDTSKEFEVEIN